MRKNFIALLAAVILILSSQTALAAPGENVTVNYLPDGSYYVTVIENETDAKVCGFSSGAGRTGAAKAAAGAVKTTTKTKTVKYYSSTNKPMWYCSLTGKFAYGNGTSVCTGSSVSAASYVSAWKVTRKSSKKRKNKAIAKVTAKRYTDGIAVEKKSTAVTLTCSPSGKVS